MIPHGKAIPELASPVASLSLAARPQICEEPENGDVYSLEPCPGHKLDGFLKVVSNYNKTFMLLHNIYNTKIKYVEHLCVCVCVCITFVCILR